MLNEPSIFAIIPVFNEEYHLESVIRGLQKVPNISILIVNDSSTDRSIEIAMNNNVTCIENVYNKGRDGAILTGYAYYLKHRANDWVVTFDSDGQHDVNFFCFLTRKTNDFIFKGNRFLILSPQHNTPNDRIVLSRKLKYLIKEMFGLSIEDANCGLIAIPHKYINWIYQNCTFDKHATVEICIKLLFNFPNKITLKEIPIPAVYFQDSIKHKLLYMKENYTNRYNQRFESLLLKLNKLKSELR